jgi:hypothetical protein
MAVKLSGQEAGRQHGVFGTSPGNAVFLFHNLLVKNASLPEVPVSLCAYLYYYWGKINGTFRNARPSGQDTGKPQGKGEGNGAA